MRRATAAIIICLAMAAPALACGHAPEEAMSPSMRMTLEQRVGSEVYQKAGLAKLSPAEQRELAAWIGQYTQKLTDFMAEYCRRRAAGDEPPAKP